MKVKKAKDSMTDRKSIFERNPIKTWFLISSFTLVIMVAIIAVLELYCGYKYYKYRDVLKNDSRAIRLKENPPRTEFFLSGKKFGKTDIILRIDSNGYVYPSAVHKNPDLKLIFLGGSTTECGAVDQDKRFPYLTGRILENSTDLEINSYNSGVSGNNSLHSLDILVNKIIPEKPDFVVFMHNINDVSTLVHTGTYWNDNRFRSPIVNYGSNLLNYRVCLPDNKLVRNLIPYISLVLLPTVFKSDCDDLIIVDEWSESDEPLHKDTAEFVSAFRKNISAFIAICKINEIEPVLMTQPSNFNNGGQYIPQFSKYLHFLFNNEIKKVALENDILLIDLSSEFSDKKKYFFDAVHLNDSGSVAASHYIANALMPKVIRKKK